MPSIYGVCDITVPNPICDPCLSDVELSGVRGVAFIHKDAIAAIKANPSSNVQWALLKDQGLIFIIPETRGTFNGGEVVTRTGFGNKATANVGFNFSLEYDDPSYKSNCAFYNQIMQSGMYHIAFMSQTQLKVSDSPVSVVPTAPLTDNVEDQAVWHIIVTWQDKLQPCPADAPNDVFVCEGGDDLQLAATADVIDDPFSLYGKPAAIYLGQGIKVSVQWNISEIVPVTVALLVAKKRPYPEQTPLSDFRVVAEVFHPAGTFVGTDIFQIPLRTACAIKCQEVSPGQNTYYSVPCSTTGSIPVVDIPDDQVYKSFLAPLFNSINTGDNYIVKGMITAKGKVGIEGSTPSGFVPAIIWPDDTEPADPCTSFNSIVFESENP